MTGGTLRFDVSGTSETPDNRQNQVTAMDTAQLTRMKHITLEPSVKEWARWASIQPDIDSRIVQWALSNPDMFIPRNAERTNPRSLAEFGRALKRYPDLKDRASWDKCVVEGNASLDESVVEPIMIFVRQNVGSPVEADTILTDPEKAGSLLERFMNIEDPRIDLVNCSNERLLAYLLSPEYRFEPGHPKNLESWLTHKHMPKDCAQSFIVRLLNSRSGLCRKLLNSPKIKSLANTGKGTLG